MALYITTARAPKTIIKQLQNRLKKSQQELRLLLAKEAKKKIPPTEMFKSETDKYSKFDDKVWCDLLFLGIL